MWTSFLERLQQVSTNIVGYITQAYYLPVPKSDPGLTALRSRWQRGWVPSGGSRTECVSSSFPASRGHVRSTADGPCDSDLCCYHHVYFLDPPAPFSRIRTLVVTLTTMDKPGSCPHLKICNLITPAKSLWPHNVT